jgi:divalent metal cation (Fe/Co/Zn/Cd) transporter
VNGARKVFGDAAVAPRQQHLERALRLEHLTVGWNVLEGAVAIAAALGARSVVLLAFGIDSFIECASGLVMIWRLRAEQRREMTVAELDATERRAERLVAASLFLLAAYVAFDAVQSLLERDRPSFTAAGIALAALSMAFMTWLARAKQRVAADLGSRAMQADAFQTTACWWLSLATLAGVGLNGLFGWWWADPVAAIAIVLVIVREGRNAWAGERACC